MTESCVYPRLGPDIAPPRPCDLCGLVLPSVAHRFEDILAGDAWLCDPCYETEKREQEAQLAGILFDPDGYYRSLVGPEEESPLCDRCGLVLRIHDHIQDPDRPSLLFCPACFVDFFELELEPHELDAESLRALWDDLPKDFVWIEPEARPAPAPRPAPVPGKKREPALPKAEDLSRPLCQLSLF